MFLDPSGHRLSTLTAGISIVAVRNVTRSYCLGYPELASAVFLNSLFQPATSNLSISDAPQCIRLPYWVNIGII